MSSCVVLLCATSGSASGALVCEVHGSLEEVTGFEVEDDVVLMLRGRNSGRIGVIVRVEWMSGLPCVRMRTRDCMSADEQPMNNADQTSEEEANIKW